MVIDFGQVMKAYYAEMLAQMQRRPVMPVWPNPNGVRLGCTPLQYEENRKYFLSRPDLVEKYAK